MISSCFPSSYRKPTLEDFEQYIPTLPSTQGGPSYSALTQMRHITTRNTKDYSLLQRALLCLGFDRLAGKPKPRRPQPTGPIAVTDDEAIETTV